MNKSDEEILSAIEKAKPGISKYLAIMDKLYTVDVSSDADFQRSYNDFYKMRQRSENWYSLYYALLERSKVRKPSFQSIIEELENIFNRCEPSFSSKLVATLDPWKPIWDMYVLENIIPQSETELQQTKVQVAIGKYFSIQRWYQEFLSKGDGKKWIGLFNQQIPTYYRITDVKKIDFILWQMRGDDDN